MRKVGVCRPMPQCLNASMPIAYGLHRPHLLRQVSIALHKIRADRVNDFSIVSLNPGKCRAYGRVGVASVIA